MSSSRSPRLGALVERHIRERYDLSEPDEGREPWMDAVGPDGSPWEIKGTLRRRSNGSPGRFRVFREPHRKLASRDGWYAFAVYRCRGRGVQVLRTNAVRARALRFDWGPSEHQSPNREGQRKVPIEQVIDA